MRIAYADPPYLGQAKRHYKDHPDYQGEVDHRELIERLNREYPDGWALSLSSPSLRYILALCPSDVRICAYVKTFATFRPGVKLAYAWEPVLLRGGRKRPRRARTIRDWISAAPPMGGQLAGAKPNAFCYWLFEALGLQKGDQLDDLYPGTGAVTRHWRTWQQRLDI